MKVVRLQLSSQIDNIVLGEEQTKLPYPFFIGRDGLIRNQDLWKGSPYKAVGFQKDLAKQQVDLWWNAWDWRDPAVIGMYLITADLAGNFATHVSALEAVDIMDLPDE